MDPTADTLGTMPRLGLIRWLILAGVIAVVIYRKRQGRQVDPPGDRPSSAEQTDVVDEGLNAAIGLVAQMRELAQTLRASVGQVLAQLRQARQLIPSALSDSSGQ